VRFVPGDAASPDFSTVAINGWNIVAGAPAGRRGGAGPAGLAWREGPRRPLLSRSIVVEDRAEASPLGEQRIAAVAEQVQVEFLVGLLLAVPLDFDRDRLGRLARG
jgi:hypothetical protein